MQLRKQLRKSKISLIKRTKRLRLRLSVKRKRQTKRQRLYNEILLDNSPRRRRLKLLL
jgi:hypothetical protein